MLLCSYIDNEKGVCILVVCGFIKLEKLRLHHKMNDFGLKEKIYIQALKVAYQKVEELKVA